MACKNVDTPTPSTSSNQTETTETIIRKDTVDIDKNILLGKFDPADHQDFVVIPKKYADRSGLYLQRVVLDSFVAMYDAAKKDGVTLTIRSATRNFHYQKGIWERKWTGATKLSDGTDAARDIEDEVKRSLKILEYSSMPGTSRHHWGTDIDLNAFNNAYFEKGKGLKEFKWLQENASSYGFARPYTSKKEGRSGYEEEKWHWSYTPISVPYTRHIEQLIEYKDIHGFKGDQTAEKIDVIPLYMLGVHSSCR